MTHLEIQRPASPVLNFFRVLLDKLCLVSRLGALHWAGIFSLVIYFLTFLMYRESAHPFARWFRELFHCSTTFILLFGYWRGYCALKRREGDSMPWAVVVYPILFCIFTALTVPFQSTDLFGYVNRGWQQAHYGLNPYATVIDDIPNWGLDTMIKDHWVNNPCPYGFLFARIAQILCTLGGGDWFRTFLLFKGLNVAVHGLTACLVWLAARKLNFPKPGIAVFLYAWNPLILMHHIANGHNDILMGGFSALGLYLAVIGAPLWVIPALVCATFIKYAAGITLPFAGVYLWKRYGLKTALIGIGLGIFTFLAFSLPYLLDLNNFKFGEMGTNATLTHNSFHALFYHFYKNVLCKIMPFLKPGIPVLSSIIKLLLWGGLLTVLVRSLMKQWKQTATDSSQMLGDFIQSTVLMQFLLVCVVSSKFYAWYMGMFFSLAFFLPEGNWLRKVILLVTGAQLFSMTFLGQSHMVNYLMMMMIPACCVVLRHVIHSRRQEFLDSTQDAKCIPVGQLQFS